ncbi:MAG TPA: cation diffusion facilitator family transporter [Acidimicrobiales bacterium]|nr:cation diffusion facilitator family transporter [Acidimicrobiales bacterium]
MRRVATFAGRSNTGDGPPPYVHGPSRHADRRYLGGALALISAFLVGEVTAAVLAGSLALLADAGHMLTDAGAIAIAIWATRLAERPATDVWTYGLKRAEILSAAVNGVALVIIAVLITVEAVERLLHPLAVTGPVLIVVAAVGIAVNLAATFVLAKANRTSLNIAGAFAHLMTDLWAFVGTAAAGVVIVTTGFSRADSIASFLIALLMLRAARQLLRDSGRVLLEAAPVAVDLTDVREHLLAATHVTDIHDLHAWVVTSDLPALSAHVVVSEECFADGHAPQILDELQACLTGHFDVEHSTFQLEPPGHTEHEAAGH